MLAGGVFIGFAQGQLTRYADTPMLSPLPGLSDALPFLVIMAVLIFRGDSLPGRDFAAAVLPRVGGGTISRYWILVWAALAALGRFDEARALITEFHQVNAPLGLLAEDLNPETNVMWGNFPQAY